MSDRRTEKRWDVCLDAVWYGKSGNYQARVTDLSEGGCYVDSLGEAQVGEVIAFKLQLPEGEWLELTGAVRYDHYSDFGDSTTPKVGFKIKPIDQLAIRGTYSEAFRAPGPAEVGGSSFGFTSVGILSQGNPEIKPEKAKSYTLGLIAEPFPGTSATVDFWRIDRTNEIVQADPAAISAGQCTTACDGSDAAHPNRVNAQGLPGTQANTFLYYDGDGNLSTVTGFYGNAA